MLKKYVRSEVNEYSNNTKTKCPSKSAETVYDIQDIIGIIDPLK